MYSFQEMLGTLWTEVGYYGYVGIVIGSSLSQFWHKDCWEKGQGDTHSVTIGHFQTISSWPGAVISEAGWRWYHW